MSIDKDAVVLYTTIIVAPQEQLWLANSLLVIGPQFDWLAGVVVASLVLNLVIDMYNSPA